MVRIFFKSAVNIAQGFDFIISSWCFYHLDDALGTLVEVFELLTPNHGVILFNGFHVGIESVSSRLRDHQLFSLFLEFSPHVVMQNLNVDRSYFRYIIMRNSESKLNLPLEYTGAFLEPEMRGQGPGTITQFRMINGH